MNVISMPFFPMRKKRLSIAAAILAGFANLASAQDRVPISFNPGATSTTINGAIRGSEYIDYEVNARGGQTMVVSLGVTDSNGNGSVFFNILPAGQDFPALYVGSNDDDNRAEVTLPSSGNWAIRVYQMGNDRDAGRTSGYSIDVYIAPGGGSSTTTAGSSNSGLLPEEDFFVVRLSNPGGFLNIRNAPRASGSLLGRLPDGVTVRNAGGCTMSDGQQWCKIEPAQGGVSGWVSARFLALPGPGGGSAGTPSNSGGSDVVKVTGVASNDVLNVRSGPGTNFGLVGALANGDNVRRLGCQSQGGSTWCEIEMMTDMRERGWVNARFLTEQSGSATQLPTASRIERVRFSSGSSGAEFTDQLGAGMSVTYVLGARNGQDLYVRLAANGSGMVWRLFNPDGSLLDEATSAREYRGQLWQSGDHKIEVTNQSGSLKSFNMIIGIQ